MGEGGAQRLKILRTALAEGRGAPGTVLDERLTVACGDGAIRILELQRAGKQPMTADEFLRGVAVPTGAALA
jgi:methionyl-tRNA formyltransferase